MRGLIEGLSSSHSLGETLPALYHQEDGFALRFTGSLDEVIAPVMLTLENFDVYLDPMTAPRDFLDWMANWVGIDLDETWPEHKQREQVRTAVIRVTVPEGRDVDESRLPELISITKPVHLPHTIEIIRT